jgi:hypothetical protein
MAGTRPSAEILRHAEQAGAKVIAGGDSGQLASVRAGGWFAALTPASSPAPSFAKSSASVIQASARRSRHYTTAAPRSTSSTKPADHAPRDRA